MGRGIDGRSTDMASGQGAPWWVSRTLNHCSNCGTRLRAETPETEHRERAVCPSCGFIAYVNPRLVVTTIPVTDSGEAVLLRRGIEPGRGAWAQPGGFLEVDETVAEAAVRETLEETGLLVEPGEIVGLYSRLEAAVVVVVFEARIVGGTHGSRPKPSRSRRLHRTRSRGTRSRSRPRTGRSATGSPGARRTSYCPTRSAAGSSSSQICRVGGSVS